eukprot:GEMP01069704.1.p1 GENE.GEMP01069704.1~~GEMP01069704.1.p1  ORF type:complete len:305 (+),score=60.70 GEMP01069704.1:84-998(+)
MVAFAMKSEITHPKQLRQWTDLNVLARRRKMSVMWQNKNLAAPDVRVRGDDLGESVALLVSQGSTSFAVQGSIKSAATFAKALPSCSTLLSLDLTDCFLFDEGCALVVQALTSTLRHLNLTKNGLTCHAVANLATQIVPSLHSLSLCQNAIGVNGTLALALAVAQAPALIALDLSNNCIASGLVYIGRAMAKDGCSLRELRVAENGLTSQDGRHFAECLQTMAPDTQLRVELSVNALGRSCFDVVAMCVRKHFKGIVGLACNGAPPNVKIDEGVRVEERPPGGACYWPWPPDAEHRDTEMVCWL